MAISRFAHPDNSFINVVFPHPKKRILLEPSSVCNFNDGFDQISAGLPLIRKRASSICLKPLKI